VGAHTSDDLDAIAGDKLDALLALGRHVVRLVVKLEGMSVCSCCKWGRWMRGEVNETAAAEWLLVV
jgi:hypothetical protein